MKVILVNEAEYELNEEKMQKMSFDTFKLVTDNSFANSNEATFPKVRVFKNMGEFNRIVNDKEIETFDTSKEILLSPKGNIFIFLKDNTDATTNTEENTTEQS